MSYGNQTTNWNNDPNNFSNTAPTSGADRRFGDDSFSGTVSGTGFDRGVGPQTGQGFHQRDDTFAGNTSDVNTLGAGGGGPGGRDRGAFAGNTTDVNTLGAGGNFTGRDTGRLGDQDWDNTNTSQYAYQGNTTDYNTPGSGYAGSTGKPSVGDRVKGTAEKLTGKLTGNPNLAERGQERKEGDFERNY